MSLFYCSRNNILHTVLFPFPWNTGVHFKNWTDENRKLLSDLKSAERHHTILSSTVLINVNTNLDRESEKGRDDKSIW